MKRTITFSLLALTLFAAGAWLRIKPTPAAAAAPPPALTFDLDKFEANIKKSLDGKSTGYAYAINVSGQLKRTGKGGVAVRASDHENEKGVNVPVEQSATKRMNIASVTKTITAAAVLRAIQDKKAVGYPNLTIESKIDPFLPPNWIRGNGVAGLSFKDLLSQYSGMNDIGDSTSIQSLRKWISIGVNRPKDNWVYINANVAIFRVVLPYMMANDQTRKAWNYLAAYDDLALNNGVSQAFRDHVRSLIFEPMDIKNADFKSADPVPTLLYNTANEAKGYPVGDWLTNGGGGGWFLSAVDLASFLAHLRYDDQVLKPPMRKLMDDNRLGWRPPKDYASSVHGKYGDYFAHGGGLNYGTKSAPVGMSSGIMSYPNGVQVALLINSLGTYGDKIVILKDAFDEAWVVGQTKANP